MVNLGSISAASLGAIIAMAAPVLVWVLVVTGLRKVAKKNAHSEQQIEIQPGKADV